MCVAARSHLSDNVTRLHVSYRLKVLLHRTVVITLDVKVVSVLFMNVSHGRFVQALRFGQTERHEIQRLAV